MIINNFIPQESIFENINSDNTKINNEKSNTFSDLLKESLDNLNEKQISSDDITNDFIAGEDVEVHEMILATEEAKMSLQLAIQIRNKVVDAIKELNGMQL